MWRRLSFLLLQLVGIVNDAKRAGCSPTALVTSPYIWQKVVESPDGLGGLGTEP